MRTQVLILVIAFISSVTVSPETRGQPVVSGAELSAHPQDPTDPCAIPPSGDWELLSTPPPESDQMLDISVRRLPKWPWPAEVPVQKEAWFHSKDGTFRYCRYFESTDRCDSISDSLDFQLRSGRWQVVSAGGVSNCPSHPPKCDAQSQLKGSAPETAADGPGKTIALRRLAERLGEKWLAPSDDIRMTITLRPPGSSSLLHFCLENTSPHALEVDDSKLPWKMSNFLRFTVLNARGKVVYSTGPFAEQSGAPPMRRIIGAWDSVEADLDFSNFVFYAAAAREDLLVMWSGEIGVYGDGNPRGKALPLSGILFVPKH